MLMVVLWELAMRKKFILYLVACTGALNKDLVSGLPDCLQTDFPFCSELWSSYVEGFCCFIFCMRWWDVCQNQMEYL